MSKREDIVKQFFNVVKQQRTVKFKKVMRDPISPEELPRTGFPAVYIETTNEERLNLTATMRDAMMDIEIIIYVLGRNRDSQRNAAIEAIESSIYNDELLNTLVKNIELTNIETITVGETKPYASIKVTFGVSYCYSLA
jgi:ABC-type proline/glycine betaine transport system ATPase subunit